MTTRARTRWTWSHMLLASALVVGTSACAAASAPKSSTRGVDSHSGSTPAPTSPDATTNPSTAASPVGCPQSGLSITVEEPDAAMGLRAMGLTVTNCGRTTRTLTGYPDIRVLGADGSRLDVEIEPGAASIAIIDAFRAEPRPITLRPGARAISGIAWRNTVTDVNGPAPSGRYLDITPLPDGPAQRVRIPGDLDLGNTARLGTAPWHTTD